MRHVKIEATKAEMFVFDSVADMVCYADGKFSSQFLRDREDFIGRKFNNFDEVEKTADELWQEGMEVLDMYLRKLETEAIPEIKSHARKTQWSWEEGDEFDPDRAAAGLPPWRKFVREESTGPTEVTIITDTTTPATMDHLDILWRGAAALAMAKILEDKGYKTNIWVVNGSQLFDRRSTGICTACELKRCQDPLDMSTLVNTISGWYYRTAIFTTLATIAHNQEERLAYGLGPCYTPLPADLDALSTDALRIYSSGVYSFNGALNMILAEVRKFAGGESGGQE